MPTITPHSTTPPMRRARIHALMAGTWPGQSGTVSFDPADLAHIADSYNPSLHEAPVVIGHPATDDPAWGWVRDAKLHHDGLWLDVELLPEMADLVDASRYKKVSVSLYTPDAPANPTPGRYYLKHLGFLGAQPPAVKGLQGVTLLSDAGETVTVTFKKKESRMEEDEIALAEKQTALAQAEADLKAKQAEIALAEQQVAARERTLRREQWTTKLDVHVNAGRLLPKDKPLLLELMERTHGQTVDLSEEQKGVSLETRLEEFLSGLPAQIELNEVSGADKAAPPAATVNFSAPAGHDVDAERLELHNRAMAYLKANPGHLYTEAIRAVGGSNV